MQSSSPIAIIMFFVVVAITLGITYWAARRAKDRSQLYAAGGQIKPWQNGLAIAGDTISASTVLGGVGMFYASGYDTNIYFVSSLAGMGFCMALIVGPLRRLGRYTLADVTTARLSPRPMRIFAAISGLAVLMMYLIGQMIGAGGLIEILFGIPYRLGVVLIGALMVIYVAFGGMLATTWVQLVKAIVLISALIFLGALTLAKTNFDISALYAQAAATHKLGFDLFKPGGMNMGALQSASLALALFVGMAGMPHIMMRTFTVPDETAARRSLVISMFFIGIIYMLVFAVIGAGAIVFLTGNPDYILPSGAARGGSNMLALHLASFIGGDALLGLIAAVAFATILAVVAGLNVAASSAVSHDLYANVIRQGKVTEREETQVFRAASVAFGGIAILLGILFEGQNILYLTGMLYSIAASASFPVIIMSIYWRRLTTVGAISGGTVGLVMSVALIIFGPTIWVNILGHAAPIFPIDQSAIIAMPVAFLVMIVVSLLTREASEAIPARAAAE